MERFVYSSVFIFCLAFSIFGILLAHKQRQQSSNKSFYSALFYQQILMTVFGFYGIWGHLLSKLLLKSQIVNSNVLERISSSISLMAIPFLLASWFFLLKMTVYLLKAKKSSLVALLALLITSGISFVAINFRFQEISNLQLYIIWYLFESIFVAVLFSTSILFHRDTRSNFKNRFFFLGAWTALFILLSLSVYFIRIHEFVVAGFILLCFLSNSWLAIGFSYVITFGKRNEQMVTGFDGFCNKYGISKRESEIIQLICEGCTNKIIAEKLFISIQTVKDHTSRIYIKTEVKNRTQLAHKVNELTT